MKQPMFSVIIPTLNEAEFLPKLLASLVLQTKKNFEVIVVDGNSKDQTVSAARSFTKELPQLSVFTSPKRGVSAQRNLGASKAKSAWLLFVDADSILLPYAIERMQTFVTEVKPQLFTTWFRPDSESIDDAMVTLLINLVIEGAVLLRRPSAQGPLSGVQRDVFEQVGGYDESLKWGEDYELTQRITAHKIPLQILRETLYIYSLRRIRFEGRFRFMQSYTKAIISALITKKTPSSMPGYIMGGHLYGKKKRKVHVSALKEFNKKLQNIITELLK